MSFRKRVRQRDDLSAPSEESSVVLHPQLRAFLSRIGEEADLYQEGAFWEGKLERFRERFASVSATLDPSEIGAAELEAIVGSGFRPLPAAVKSPEEDPEYREALELEKGVRQDLRRISPAAYGVEQAQWEHMRALRFLRDNKALDGYTAVLRDWGIRSTPPLARYFWYALTIRRLVENGHLPERQLDVLEIGAGPTRLGCILHRLGLVRTYWVVELPERILTGAYVVNRWLPEVELSIETSEVETSHGAAFRFLVPRALDAVPERSFDLMLNFNSFMEMDRDQRDHYIREIYRTGRLGSVFYNVNRHRRLPQRDGGVFDNNPLTYPYRPDDDIVFWEQDEFQQATRSGFHQLPSVAIARASRVRPPDSRGG